LNRALCRVLFLLIKVGTMKMTEQVQWRENVILVDVDYMDRLIFEVSVQLERILCRRMPKLDIAKWLDYVALDGGLRPAGNSIQVMFIYEKDNSVLKNMLPSDLKRDLDGKAFSDNLGEFTLSSFPVETDVVSRGQLYVQSVEALLSSKQVKRMMLVADMGTYGAELKALLGESHDKDITLFVLQQENGFRVVQEMLSYSITAALGVRGDEMC